MVLCFYIVVHPSLFYEGQRLENKRTLGFYGIKHKTVIHSQERVPSSEFLYGMSNDLNHLFTVLNYWALYLRHCYRLKTLRMVVCFSIALTL